MTLDLVSTPVICPGIGEASEPFSCCTLEDQDNCGYTFFEECPTKNCIADCSDASWLFSPQQGALGFGPFRRYWACASAPGTAQYLEGGLLEDRWAQVQRAYFPASSSDQKKLKAATGTVTQCLADTCSKARDSERCRDACAPINVILNNTVPDIRGVNSCLYELCGTQVGSIPYASEDVVGIGVFASYVMQIAIVIFFVFGFVFTSLLKLRRNADRSGSKALRHEESLVSALVEFHKAQCFFSMAIQIASLVLGVFDKTVLSIFLLLPLATNGTIPVMLAYILIYRYGRKSTYLTTLTFLTWLLSTIVLWELYRKLIGVTTLVQSADPRLGSDEPVYYPLVNRFMDDISNLDSCGGHSALTVCPESGYAYGDAFDKMVSASHRMRTYPPLIWTWSTMLFLGTRMVHYMPRLKWTANTIGTPKEEVPQWRTFTDLKWLRMLLTPSAAFWFAVAVSISAIALQLGLLALNGTLNVINNKNWSFGQIVAVMIWVAPFAEYLHFLHRGHHGSEYRLAPTLSVTRSADATVDKDTMKDGISKPKRQDTETADRHFAAQTTIEHISSNSKDEAK